MGVDPTAFPPETVHASGARAAALADAVVVAAWADHHEEIYAFLVRTTRDVAVAEDLLQESFLRLTREARAGRTPDNVRAWLYRVASNLATSRARRFAASLRGFARIAVSPVVRRTEELPEARYLEWEGRAALVAAVDDLSPDARAALLLSSEGFSVPEIAAAIGRTPLATRSLLWRTRLRLRSQIAPTEGVR
jgi:RNA polymerase sigma-70 factor, ECF subfamily